MFLAKLASVPARGGLVLSAASVVLTRSAAGELHAFSSVCTHQGCPVNQVSGTTIHCPCHGSRFDAATGAVVTGPAARALAPVRVSVRGGSVYTS